ncbi:MAG: ABC transporter permease [Actinomycetota bacterium]
MLSNLIQDVRYGMRVLRKAPTFTAVAVITLALGIGANAAMFAVFSAFVLKPLPFRDPDRIVAVWDKRPGMGVNVGGMFFPPLTHYRAILEQSHTLQQVAAFHAYGPRLAGPSGTTKIKALKCSANLLDLLGFRVAAGRNFSADETTPGRNNVTVLTAGYAVEHFGSVRAAVGKSLTLDGVAHVVVGVLPQDFRMPNLMSGEMRLNPELLLPLDTSAAAAGKPGSFVNVLARLKPDFTLDQARSDVAVIARQFEKEDMPGLTPVTGVAVLALRSEDRNPDSIRRLLIFQVAVGFILLIACVNIANLLLARATERRKELAVRLALGASRARILAQMLAESLTLGTLGSIAGLLLAQWFVVLVIAIAPGDFLEGHRPSIDPRVLVFTIAATIITSILFGLAPALHSLRQKIQDALAQTGRSVSGQGNRTRSALVIAELSLALVLLVGAGLLIRTLRAVHGVDPGFQPQHLLTAVIQLPPDKYRIDPKNGDDGKLSSFSNELLARVRALPGVESATISGSLPMRTIELSTFHLEGQSDADQRSADMTSVRDDYFRTMGIPIVKGRGFRRQDLGPKSRVIVMSEMMAKALWPRKDPLGKKIITGTTGDGAYTVIGIAQDTHDLGLDAPPTATVYRIGAPQNLFLIVRTAGDLKLLMKPLREQVAAVDEDVPVSEIRPMQQVVESTFQDRRFHMWLFVVFSALALGLAAIGQYGVLAYTVSARTREIGIRMALGAQVADVLHMIIRQGLALAGFGVVIGLGAAAALSRLMKSFVFGVKTVDPLTYAITAAVLIGVAVCACYIPARRAARVDPMVALRCE